MTRQRIAALVIFLVAAALRLYQLTTLRPFHHDEGVNGFFMTRLVREHAYKYDPANYHGPSLYYFTLPLTKIFGFESFSLRIEPVIFGLGIIVLIFMLGRRLGGPAALWGAAMVAVSPGMVYISRYFIHEMMVLFFTLGIIVAYAYYNERPSIWSLFGGAASAGFLFATKETAGPTVVVLLIALGMTKGLMRLSESSRRDTPSPRRSKKKRKADDVVESPPEPPDLVVAPPHRRLDLVIWSVCLFLVINMLLYNSFFTNKDGVKDALKSLMIWTKTGETAHVHEWWQYLRWMSFEEPVALAFGFAGIGLALIRRNNAIAVLCAFWALGMVSMYSLIKYKTPWLTVNLVLPLCVIGGWGLQEMGRMLDGYDPAEPRAGKGTFAVLGIGLASLALSLTLCISLNFVHYDDNRDEYVYVYAHTVRDIYRLLGDIDTLSARAKGQDTVVKVVGEHYWPLPWYMKDYKHAEFFGRMVPLQEADLAIALPEQEAEVQRNSGGMLTPVGTYDLRPGVKLVLWARTSLGRP